MSLLLDALKKAALEKQKRDKLSAEQIEQNKESSLDVEKSNGTNDKTEPVDVLDTRLPPVDLSEIDTLTVIENIDETSIEETLIHENEISEELTFDIDLDALGELDMSEELVNNDHEDKNKKNSEHEEAVEQSPSASHVMHAQPHPESEVNNNEHTEVDVQISIDPHSEADSESKHNYASLDEKEVSQESDVEPSNVNPPNQEGLDINKHLVDKNEALENTSHAQTQSPVNKNAQQKEKESASSNQEEQKSAFAQILENNKRISKKKKRIFIAMYICLTLIVMALVIMYYLYITSLSGSSLQSSFPVSENDSADVFDSTEFDSSLDNGMANSQVINDGVLDDVLNPADVLDESIPKTQQREDSGAVTTKAIVQTSNNKKAINDAYPKKSTIKPQVKNESASSKNNNSNNTAKNADAKTNIITIGEPKYDALTDAVQRGFILYSNGQFSEAASAYNQALALDPYNRDALLGSAAVATTQNRFDDALGFYQRRLSRAPNDDYAHAGILAIASSRDVSPQLMSRVNTLLNDFPDAPHLYFLQGSLYAANSQWQAAQASFFNAWHRDTHSAIYAFNLAVSLDHLRQQQEALRFYRLAYANRQASHVNIDVSTLERRILQLQQVVEGTNTHVR